jgi:hypothetical protein
MVDEAKTRRGENCKRLGPLAETKKTSAKRRQTRAVNPFTQQKYLLVASTLLFFQEKLQSSCQDRVHRMARW